MSKGIKLEHVCTHEVVHEVLELDSRDRRSLRPLRPPATSDVKLWVNGYKVEKDHSVYGFDLVVDTITAEVTLSPAESTTVKDWRITDQTEVVVTPVNDAAKALAILEVLVIRNGEFTIRHSKATGTEVVAYTFPARLDRGRKVFFKRQLPATDDLFELSYVTDPINCRRAFGLRLENDVRFNKRGRVITVKNEEKLLQDVEKFVVTIRGSNPYHPYVGSGLMGLIGTAYRSPDLVRLKLVQEVTDTLENLRDLQLQQDEYQYITEREFFAKLESVEMEQSPLDPTVFMLHIEFSNITGGIETFEKRVALPGPQALLKPLVSPEKVQYTLAPPAR